MQNVRTFSVTRFCIENNPTVEKNVGFWYYKSGS